MARSAWKSIISGIITLLTVQLILGTLYLTKKPPDTIQDNLSDNYELSSISSNKVKFCDLYPKSLGKILLCYLSK